MSSLDSSPASLSLGVFELDFKTQRPPCLQSQMTTSENTIVVRKCEPDDLAAVSTLAARLVREHHAADSDRFMIFDNIEEGYADFLHSQLRRRESVVLVAARSRDVVGYIYGRVEPRDWNVLRERCGVFHDIYVDAAFRRQGIATQLMVAALAELENLGVPRVVLMTAAGNEQAQRLFRQLGFRPTMIEMTRETP